MPLLLRLIACGQDSDGDCASITPSRSDTRGRIAAAWRNLFCIRLHFVLEERIGVAKISVEQFLMIDESARCLGRQGPSQANATATSKRAPSARARACALPRVV